jgi:hyperosmotically inducible periplasmic protein
MRRANVCKAPAVVVMAVLLLVGCAAITGRDTPEDARITTEVKARLAADPLVSASWIDVDTSRGVVRLRGSVASEQERQRAIQLTQGVAGVQEIIVRNLMVRR